METPLRTRVTVLRENLVLYRACIYLCLTPYLLILECTAQKTTLFSCLHRSFYGCPPTHTYRYSCIQTQRVSVNWTVKTKKFFFFSKTARLLSKSLRSLKNLQKQSHNFRTDFIECIKFLLLPIKSKPKFIKGSSVCFFNLDLRF